jgi:hypothetical protein
MGKLSLLKIDPGIKDSGKLPHLAQPYYIFSNRAIYMGSWKFGVPSGFGIMYEEIGDVQEGQFENA